MTAPDREDDLRTRPRLGDRLRVAYARIAPALLIFCCLAVIFCSVAVMLESRTNHAQDQQRLTDQSKVQACFNKFAASLVGGLPPVREATVARDGALDKAMGTLQATLAKVVTQSVKRHDVVRLVSALQHYQSAERHLAAVREENPYPAAPAKLCDLIASNDSVTPKAVPTPSVPLVPVPRAPRSREPATSPSRTASASESPSHHPGRPGHVGHSGSPHATPSVPQPSPSPSPSPVCLPVLTRVCLPPIDLP